jgi:hypothetical protein
MGSDKYSANQKSNQSQQGAVVAIFAGLTVRSFSGHLFKLTYLYQTK